jgi:hypothetical protein
VVHQESTAVCSALNLIAGMTRVLHLTVIYMTLKEKILFHQIHPAKLATDIAAAVVSVIFLWQHSLTLGLLTHFIPPPIGSALVIRFGELESYKTSSFGAYLVRYMTPTVQMTRLAGDLLMVVAAWYQSPIGIIIGLIIILFAWTYGFLLARPY